MNRYQLVKGGIDVAQGIERMGSMEEYVALLSQFPQDPHTEDLRKALEEKDANRAFEAAHALKGIAGNLSLEDLYEALDPLVERLRNGESEGIGELAAKAMAQSQKAKDAILSQHF